MTRSLRSSTKIERGLEYDALSLANTRSIEGSFDSPGTFIDEEVPYAFWGQVAERIKGQISGTPHDWQELLAARTAAWAFARSMWKNKVNVMTPMRSQFDFHDLLAMTDPHARACPEACRAFREALYWVFQNEYMARGVG